MDDDWKFYLLLIVGTVAGVAAFVYGIYRLGSWMSDSDQRACVAACMQAHHRPTRDKCEFWCAWERPRSDTTVVPVVVPVSQ